MFFKPTSRKLHNIRTIGRLAGSFGVSSLERHTRRVTGDINRAWKANWSNDRAAAMIFSSIGAAYGTAKVCIEASEVLRRFFGGSSEVIRGG